jgi:hypothetical protein
MGKQRENDRRSKCNIYKCFVKAYVNITRYPPV